jgi:hypothetical protein
MPVAEVIQLSGCSHGKMNMEDDSGEGKWILAALWVFRRSGMREEEREV